MGFQGADFCKSGCRWSPSREDFGGGICLARGAPRRLRVSRGARLPLPQPSYLGSLVQQRFCKGSADALRRAGHQRHFAVHMHGASACWDGGRAPRVSGRRCCAFLWSTPTPPPLRAREQSEEWAGRKLRAGLGNPQVCHLVPACATRSSALARDLCLLRWRSLSPSPRLEGCAGDAGWEGGIATLEVALRARTAQSLLPSPPYPFNPQ